MKKKLYIVALAAFGILYSVYSFVILPRYIASLYNIAYENTPVPDILNYLAGAVEMIAMSIFYGILCYLIYRLGYKKVRGAIWVFVIANMYKYTSNVIMSWVDNGSIPREWLMDILNAIFYTAMELITFAIIWFTVRAIIERGKAERSGKAYPIEGIYRRGNYLMFSALISAVIIFGLKFIFQVINDILTIKEIVNVTLMLVSYGSNLLFGVICYFVMIFTLIVVDEKFGRF